MSTSARMTELMYQSSWIWESYQKWHFQAKFDVFLPNWVQGTMEAHYQLPAGCKIIDSFQKTLLKAKAGMSTCAGMTKLVYQSTENLLEMAFWQLFVT